MRIKNDVMGTIMEILQKNENKWITVTQIISCTGFRRSSVNHAINNLLKKDLIERVVVKSSKNKKMNKIRVKYKPPRAVI